MAVFAGPKTVSDGLVFQIDQDNTQKSFKGKPTVNYWYENGGGGATIIGIDDLPEIEELAKLLGGKRNIKNPRRQSTQTNWMDLYNSSTGITVQPGEQLRISLYVYTEKSTNRFNCNANWGATLGTNAGMGSSDPIHDIEPYKWSRITFSKTNTTGSAISVTSSRVETYSTSEWSPDTIDAYCTNPQWEVGDFTTPFVAGTRSNTQSVIDIIGGRTVTAHNLTYNSDGTFTFGGSPDSIEIDTASVPSGNQITFECWAKVNTVSSSSIIEARNSDDGRTINVHLPWGNNIVYFDCGGGSGAYQRITYETNASQRTGWHHWVFTKNASTGIMAMYLDGKLLTSSTGQTNTIGQTATVRLGSYATGSSNFWQGELDQARLYNKALTVNEVVTNFEASRDRYGV